MKEIKDYLEVIEIIGKILIFTPIIVALLILVFSMIGKVSLGINDSSAGFSSGLMITAGIIMMIYVTIKRYRQS